MTWQPINSAPKDGTWCWVMRYPNPKALIEVSAFRWDPERQMWFAGTGWWYDPGFTHWAPMASQPPAWEHPEEPRS